MLRQPARAGQFYPGTESKLVEMIEQCFKDDKIGPGKLPDKTTPIKRTGEIFALVSPHAGYFYSGAVAAHGFLEQFKDGKPEFFVIVGPNHTGAGPAISVYPEGRWETPIGEAVVPGEIVKKIVKEPKFRRDTSAHREEHSIEVQVPFLQYLYGEDVQIIPICLKDQSKDNSIHVGDVLSKILSNYDYCMIASTDLTHFESQADAMRKDKLVIDNIRNLDAKGVQDVVLKNHISMCGPGPVATVLTAAHHNGVKTAEILRYSTSGDVTGDKNAVVAYLSAVLRR